MADLIVMSVVCVVITRKAFHNGTSKNNKTNNTKVTDAYRRQSQAKHGPQSRRRALLAPPHQSRVATFNEIVKSGSPLGPYCTATAPTSHAEFPTHDFDDEYPGNWDCYYDSYEPESETYDYADDWHQV